MPPDLARKLFERGAAVWNMYGPTETTVWSTLFRVRSGIDPVLIGRPVANTTVYILDRHLYPAPIGVPGELFIGGDGLARGYRNRPDLTSERFIANPFTQNGKMYRTGDLARYRPDGMIECLGRIDHQVKVRGHRIELGEIESIINRFRGVRQSAVIVREDTPGDQRITAYLVPERDNGSIPVPDIREHVRSNLPEYMVPSFFVTLERLPLTPNGKIDRRSLPVPDNDTAGREHAYIAPRNEREQRIANIWAEVLKVERVGIEDIFFNLGGHSVLATELVNRLNRDLGLGVKLQMLFLEPTIAGLIRNLDQPDDSLKLRYSRSDLLFPIQANGTRPPLFVAAGAHARDEDFLRYLSFLIPSLGDDQPVYGFRPRGVATNDKVFQSVESMAAEYVKIMLEILPDGPYLVGGECVGGIVAYEIAQQLRAQNKDVALLALLDAVCPSPSMAVSFRLRRIFFVEEIKLVLKLATSERPGRFLRKIARLFARKMREQVAGGEQVKFRRRHLHTQVQYRHILFRYRPRKYDGKLTLVVNTEENSSNPTLGWENVDIKETEIHMVPGNHLTRLTVYGNSTGKVIRECIERALEQTRRKTHESADIHFALAGESHA